MTEKKILTICFVISTYFSTAQNFSQDSLIGKTYPEINVKTITHEVISSKQLKDTILVLNFWNSGCKPCIAEIPGLDRLVNEYRTKKVRFLAFSYDEPEVIREKFIKQKKFLYTHIITEADSIYKYYQANGFPTNFVIDRNNKILLHIAGGLVTPEAGDAMYRKIKKAIDKALE
jgi:thiol-disulfide isomerase/thioredoxin